MFSPAFRSGSPLTNFGPVSRVSDASEALQSSSKHRTIRISTSGDALPSVSPPFCCLSMSQQESNEDEEKTRGVIHEDDKASELI